MQRAAVEAQKKQCATRSISQAAYATQLQHTYSPDPNPNPRARPAEATVSDCGIPTGKGTMASRASDSGHTEYTKNTTPPSPTAPLTTLKEYLATIMPQSPPPPSEAGAECIEEDALIAEADTSMYLSAEAMYHSTLTDSSIGKSPQPLERLRETLLQQLVSLKKKRIRDVTRVYHLKGPSSIMGQHIPDATQIDTCDQVSAIRGLTHAAFFIFQLARLLGLPLYHFRHLVQPTFGFSLDTTRKPQSIKDKVVQMVWEVNYAFCLICLLDGFDICHCPETKPQPGEPFQTVQNMLFFLDPTRTWLDNRCCTAAFTFETVCSFQPTFSSVRARQCFGTLRVIRTCRHSRSHMT